MIDEYYELQRKYEMALQEKYDYQHLNKSLNDEIRELRLSIKHYQYEIARLDTNTNQYETNLKLSRRCDLLDNKVMALIAENNRLKQQLVIEYARTSE